MRVESLVELRGTRTGLIGVDGELGAGKTTVSKRLHRCIGGTVLHLDDYIENPQRSYVESIDYERLNSDYLLSKAPIIIEGSCLLHCVERLGIDIDLHIIMYRNSITPYAQDNKVVYEVDEYLSKTSLKNYRPSKKKVPSMTTNKLDVDIAYLKSKMWVSLFLAFGGVVAIVTGAIVLMSGVANQDTAVFQILGAKVTATGIGAIILGSSVLWAYFAYAARPKYSSKKELSNTINADGSSTEYHFESSTMQIMKPERHD